MKRNIKILSKNIKDWERALYNQVCKLGRTMNECQCDHRRVYSFRNIVVSNEPWTYCLNCGGYVEPDEAEYDTYSLDGHVEPNETNS